MATCPQMIDLNERCITSVLPNLLADLAVLIIDYACPLILSSCVRHCAVPPAVSTNVSHSFLTCQGMFFLVGAVDDDDDGTVQTENDPLKSVFLRVFDNEYELNSAVRDLNYGGHYFYVLHLTKNSRKDWTIWNLKGQECYSNGCWCIRPSDKRWIQLPWLMSIVSREDMLKNAEFVDSQY